MVEWLKVGAQQVFKFPGNLVGEWTPGNKICPEWKLSMDTDDLTEMAYGTLRIAEEISHWLTIELALSGKESQDESAFLDSMLSAVRRIKKDVSGWIDENEEEVSPSQLRAGLHKLGLHIRNTLQTPIELRGPKPDS
jgi:hypothetical protein